MALVVPEHLNPTGIQLRMAGSKDVPLFCLSDVCQVMNSSNVTMVKDRLEPDEFRNVELVDVRGRRQEMVFVTEPGLYRIVATSRAENAKPFQRWIYHDVLPTIRRFGCYPAPAHPGTSSAQTSVVPGNEFREMMESLRRLERRQASQDVVDRVPGVVEARQYIRELWPHCPDRTAQNIVRRLDQLYRDEIGRPAPKLGYAPSAPLACEYENMRLLFRAVSHFWREAHPDLGPDSLPFDQAVS